MGSPTASKVVEGAASAISEASMKIAATSLTVANVVVWLNNNINALAGMLGICISVYTFFNLRQKRKEEQEEFLRRKKLDEDEAKMRLEEHEKIMSGKVD